MLSLIVSRSFPFSSQIKELKQRERVRSAGNARQKHSPGKPREAFQERPEFFVGRHQRSGAAHILQGSSLLYGSSFTCPKVNCPFRGRYFECVLLQY